MSGNQWGPPPGQQYPPPQPPPPWQQRPAYGPPPVPSGPPLAGPPGPPFQGPGQPQFGWGAPPGGPRRPKKSRGGLIALFVVLGVLLLGVVGLKIVSASLKGHSGSDGPYSAEPTYSSSYSPSPSTEPNGEPSGQPTTRPTVTRSATTRPTTQAPRPTASRTTTTSRPRVNPGPSDTDLVVRNKLYTVGAIKPVGCKESRSRQTSVAGARANYRNLVACLNKAWAPMVARAGGRFRAPSVLMFSGTVSSPCGTHSDSGPPFYCTTNDTIYMNLTQDIGNYNNYPEAYNKVWARMWMLHQFAHEYGHHVQNMVGIFPAYARIRYERATYAKELEDSRRLELQASCFSDIFIGSNRRSYPITGQSLFQWRFLIGNTIDPQHDHGAPAIHKYWAQRGWDARNPTACNTFAASSSKVQ